MTQSPQWDVLVAGAGPAGAVAAFVLAGRGRRVLLVDDVAPDARKVGESLPGAARPLLSDLGLLERVEGGPHLRSYGNVSAWGCPEPRATDSIRDPHGPGWHLDRPRFDQDLRDAAREAGAGLRRAQALRAEAVEDGWRVELKGGAAEPVEARWLVDGTGRRATLARGLGARRLRDEPLVALVAWIDRDGRAAGDRDTRTLVEAVPEGWWYTARLPEGSRVVVYHVDGGEAAAILHTPGAWAERLARTVHVRRALAGPGAGPGGDPGAALKATEASGARLDRFAGEGWLAVGDAALSFDPLSSQGLLNALYTGMRGGQAVHAALGGDPAPRRAYGERLKSVREAYLRHHRAYYRAEHRWPESPFWARRGRRGPRGGANRAGRCGR